MLGEELYINILAWIIGFAVVTIFSWNFFNAGDYYLDSPSVSHNADKDKLDFREPLLPIYATSRWRYRKWFMVFLTFTLSLYVLMAYAINEPTQGDNKLEWYKSYSQIFAAFLISGFVNALPKKLQYLDLLRWVRNMTHRRAKIPHRALSIFRNIMSYDLDLNDQQIESAINCVGSEYLNKKYFALTENTMEQNTIEKNWSKTCHLFTCINIAGRDANSRYAQNLGLPELVYEQAIHNFEIVKDDIKSYNSNRDNIPLESLKERTRLLLKQVSKLFVCLVFASEIKEEQIFRKLKETGVNLKKRINYELKISTIVTSMLVFALLTWISVYALAIFTGKLQIDPSKTHLISLAAVLIICAPIMLTFFIKTMSTEIWPVRGQHSNRKNFPPVIMFLLGIGMGLMGFFAMSYTNLFASNAWYEFWPYTLMSGAISAIAAIVIDTKPRVLTIGMAAKSALLCGAISIVTFVVIAMFSVIVVGDVQPDFGKIKQAIAGSDFTLAISAWLVFYPASLFR